MNYFQRIIDQHVDHAFRQVVDALNQIRTAGENTTTQIAALVASQPTIQQIQQQLQVGGEAPLNVTGLPGSTSSGTVGTHAQRLTTPAKVGTFFFETDRTILYVGKIVSSAAAWVYAAGEMFDSFANRPTDLGANDAGFLYIPSEHLHWCRWGGAAWVILDNDAGTFIDSAVALGTGYQLCDGTATTYLAVSGATLVETSFTTPDETSNGAARSTFHRSSNVYSGTVTPATTPGFAGTIDSATTGISTGSGSFSTTAPTATALTPPLTDPGHTHGVTGLTVTLPDSPVQYLNVLRYFRR